MNRSHFRCSFASCLCMVGALGARPDAATTVVDPGTKYQTIRGFGASTAWGSSLKSGDADLLWSNTKGAGLSLHRVHIDDASGSTSELNIAKQAVSYGVTVWATPWTPPAADKSNSNTVMGSLSNASAFATYLVNFVSKMKAAGVPIYAVSAQNEPDANVTYESCVYTPAQMVAWVGKTMGPAIAGIGGVKVMAPETQNWCGFKTFWPVLKADADFMKYTDILATHEYGCSATAYPDIAAAGKDFWETEIYDTYATTDNGIGSGLRVAKLIHDAMVTSSMNAWHYWWVYGGSNGGLFNTDNGGDVATKRLWVMGNYSRFVKPGYVRIAATAAPTSGVTVSAYAGVTDNRVVIVAINTNASAISQTFSLAGSTGAKVAPWITDGSRNVAADATQTVSGNAFTYSLPSQSVTTFAVDLPATTALGSGSEPRGSLLVRPVADGYSVELPNAKAGLIEILSPAGERIESRLVSEGTREISVRSFHHHGLVVVKFLQDGDSFASTVLQP